MRKQLDRLIFLCVIFSPQTHYDRLSQWQLCCLLTITSYRDKLQRIF